MTLEFRPLHPLFAAEAAGVELRSANDPQVLAAVGQGMDEYAVLVFRDQPFDDQEQMTFARRFDGELHAKTGSRVVKQNRFGNEALTDISNLDERGEVLPAEDRRRLYGLGNRLWHTDASFEDPPGRYSMLHARVIPPSRADTEFADMRSAYDHLGDDIKATVEDLRVHHSIAYSRQTLGFEFSEEEAAVLAGAVHPLVRTFAGSNRRSLYLASHASRIEGWTLPEGRLLLRELMEHATQSRFVFRHQWRVNDLVIWDNRATMHRATPFADHLIKRELRRVTTLNLPIPA